MIAVFEQDWAQTDSGKKEAKKAEKAEKKGAQERPAARRDSGRGIGLATSH